MSKYEIPFLTACIRAFGRRFDMTRQAAFRYLHEHKGLAFLIEFYDVEHLQSMDETIDDLLIICQKNGGTLANRVPYGAKESATLRWNCYIDYLRIR